MLERTSFARRYTLLLTVLLFGFIATARLITLYFFGYDIPYWDQWDSEAWFLLRPFQMGELDWRILFSPHNEHRILLTRLTSLAIFVANNRQWDNLVEICFNALFYSAALAIFIRRMAMELPWRGYLPLFGLATFIACLPFCSENLLTGFQNSFYYLIVLTVTGIWVASSGRPTLGRIAGLSAIAFGCIFSMASGALSLPAILVAATLRWWRERNERGRLLLLGAILAPATLAALALVPKIPGHEPLRAQNLGEFAHAAILALSWPFSGNWEWMILLWAPYAWAGSQLLRRKLIDPKDITAFSLGGWVIVQALAMSYVRGNQISEVATRYTDILVWGILVNAYFAIRYYCQSQGKSHFVVAVVSSLLTLYTGAMVVRTKQGLGEIAAHAAFSRLQIENVRHFVRNGDFAELKKQPLYHIPYPDPDRLAMMLRDPAIRDTLPASVRAPISLQSNVTFVANGYYPAMSNSSDRPVLGSYTSTAGNSNVGQMKAALKTRFPYLDFDVAGYPDQPGMKLSLASTNPARELPLLLSSTPKESWEKLIVETPADEFSLEASDSNPSSWFAFSEPVEIGRLSLWTTGLLSRVTLIAVIYIFAIVLSALYFWFTFWSKHKLHEDSTTVTATTAHSSPPLPRVNTAAGTKVLRQRNSSPNSI